MKYITKSTVFISFFVVFAATAYSKNVKAFNIYTSIKPLYSLVATITVGTPFKPKLLYAGSPNSKAKISSTTLAQTANNNDLFFIIDQNYEASLYQFLQSNPSFPNIIEATTFAGVSLADANNYKAVLNATEGSNYSKDYHIWLDPLNTKAILIGITNFLSSKDPRHARAFKSNLNKALKTIDYSYNLFTRVFKPYTNAKFLYYVDGYNYFSNRFGLKPKGVIFNKFPENLSREESNRLLDSKGLDAIKTYIKQNNITCVFLDASTSNKSLIRFLSSNHIAFENLDYLGSIYPADSHLYFKLTANNFGAYKKCLSKK